MTDYSKITDLTLAKQIDEVLKTLILYYSNEAQRSILPAGVAKQMNKDGIVITEEEVRSIMHTMQFHGFLTYSDVPGWGLSTQVSQIGYFTYSNGGLYKQINQEEDDRELAREVNRSVKTASESQIKVGKTQTRILSLTVVISVISLTVSISTCNHSREPVKVQLLPIQEPPTIQEQSKQGAQHLYNGIIDCSHDTSCY